MRSIDLVYAWVDGSDPVWMAKKEAALSQQSNKEQINTQGRYVNNQELKYSLRSVNKYLPWVRKIYIITDNQVPTWLNTKHPEIQIIDHTDIIPAEFLPCFSSRIIEYFMYKIPDLSEQFLYANDDMFVNAHLMPSYFFDYHGHPMVRLQRLPFQRLETKFKNFFKIRTNNYRKSIENSIALIKQKYGVYYPGVLHHNIDAYRKSDFQAVVADVFHNEIAAMLPHQFRQPTDIQRVILHYYALAINHGTLKFTKRKESARLRVHKGGFQEYLDRYQPDLFCLNDSERATDKDREKIVPFLENLFPKKSEFEL